MQIKQLLVICAISYLLKKNTNYKVTVEKHCKRRQET